MSLWSSSVPTTSKVAPTPNCAAWPNPSAAGSRKNNFPADRVSRFSPTIIPRWVAAYLGIIASGCAAVPLDTALHDDQVTKLLKDSGAAAIFCDAKHVPVARPAATELKLGMILTDPDRSDRRFGKRKWLGDMPAIFEAGPGNFTPAAANDSDLASLLYTSGTTADPKGVMLTHSNFQGEVEAVFDWVELGPSRRSVGRAPPVSRSGADGQSPPAAGQGLAGCLSGDPQHYGTSPRFNRAEHHGVCRGAPIFLLDS